MPQTISDSQINDELASAIDDTIKEILGQPVVTALHTHFQKFYGWQPNEIPFHLDILSHVLENQFGASSRVVERSIAKHLYTRLGITFSVMSEYSLVSYVERAKGALRSQDRA